ncbi:zinc metalloproteinase nas-13-like isoform X1 [Ostrea edulis]|uniref:zinc metalloproteinase nas-13-like isoform X1 n=1 Tax=Ostrea edulis TaxID=37623 RepID=UPI0024AF37AC|nr:zinc metalloproteinase nas-13-like isoform X1 [Ostrea edulis]
MEKISLILVVALFIYCEGQLDRRTPPKDLTIDQIMSRMLGGYGAIANRLTLPGGLVLKELDMYVTQEQFNALNSNSKRKRRKAVRNPVSYWDGGRVPYRFTPGHFDDGDQYFVKVAMRELEKYTCLRFKERTTETDYVDMMDSQGCWSRLGKEGGRQELSLDRNGCRFKGLYLHEIGHAVGLIHEQNRPDRDGYIRINEQNIQPGLKDQFNKYPVSYINTYAIPYDFPSVMHYGVTAFSRDGRSQTISALPAYKDKEAEIGRVYQKELSFGDVRVLNAMYRCNDHCDDSVRCDGGFLDQNCECICPDGTSDCMIGKTKLNPGCRNSEDDWKCNVWAKQGECRRRSEWMNTNCARACGSCGNSQNVRQDQENVCENVYDDDTCNEWRDNGDCVVAEDWMRQNCKMSCNYCSKSNPRPNTNCMNAYSDDTKCRGWALEGECVINPAWMPINCASDCHSCKNNGSIPDEGTKTTRTPTQTRPPVVTTPPPTTPPPDSCEDRYPTSGCQRFQSRWNYCTIYKMWMDANCMKTCELCSGGKREKELDSCKDENRYCPDWARRGDCVFNPSYMLSNCKKSCRVCTSGLREGSDELVQQLMAENGSTRSAVSQLSILIAICTVAVLV